MRRRMKRTCTWSRAMTRLPASANPASHQWRRPSVTPSSPPPASASANYRSSGPSLFERVRMWVSGYDRVSHERRAHKKTANTLEFAGEWGPCGLESVLLRFGTTAAVSPGAWIRRGWVAAARIQLTFEWHNSSFSSPAAKAVKSCLPPSSGARASFATSISAGTLRGPPALARHRKRLSKTHGAQHRRSSAKVASKRASSRVAVSPLAPPRPREVCFWCRSSIPRLLRRAAQHWAHLYGHVRRSPARPWRGRSPRGDLLGMLRAFHIDDPVSGEKLLRFREDPIGNRLSVASRANDLGLVGERQSLGGNQHACVLEFLVEGVHISELRLQVLLRPLRVPVKIAFCARHHQNVLHGFCSFWILAPQLSSAGAFSTGSRIRIRGSLHRAEFFRRRVGRWRIDTLRRVRLLKMHQRSFRTLPQSGRGACVTLPRERLLNRFLNRP